MQNPHQKHYHSDDRGNSLTWVLLSSTTSRQSENNLTWCDGLSVSMIQRCTQDGPKEAEDSTMSGRFISRDAWWSDALALKVGLISAED